MYLILVRPVERTIFEMVTENKSLGKQHLECMFSCTGQRISPEEIRISLSQNVSKNDIPFNFQEYIHHTAAMVQIITIANDEGALALLHEVQTVAHAQAGHCVRMADSIYGRSEPEVEDVGHTEATKYRQFCKMWHQHLGLALYREGSRKPPGEACGTVIRDKMEEMEVWIYKRMSKTIMSQIRDVPKTQIMRKLVHQNLVWKSELIC